ncbi:MAG: Dam family site-specific DNA-(adenine-N6)-methyltransferase [Bacteroidales bacterium]|jgi:DNA adenine methylase|nr:Dam family site-specific DNA-(adenine-N6)-methyltransferase [Bacteroidales bacterium]
MFTIQPVIKWSGSKRSQAAAITQYIPNFNRYYEPFVGGGSIAYAISPDKGLCGDIYEPLINLWRLIQSGYETLLEQYRLHWDRLQNEGYLVFYEIREKYNKNQNPADLFFLSRTCVNGLIRFNKNGEFNNSLHHTRKGIDPMRLKSIMANWSERLQGVEFQSGDYWETTQNVRKGDFVYLDPPYFHTKGRYFGTIDFERFTDYLVWLNKKNVNYALSFDGIRGETDYMIELPKELYKRHLMLSSGNSSFKKVMDKKNETVYESLYLNY